MMRRRLAPVPAIRLAGALAFVAPLVACGAPPAAHGTHGAVPAATDVAVPEPVTPVPETLALVAGQFGLTMQAEGFRWKVLRRNVTRFDWAGRPTSGGRELLYSFYMEKIDDASAKLLPHIVGAAAANLTDGEPCPPVEQPAGIVQALGVDRVITVCFEPSTLYGTEYHQGVLHGIVHKGALSIVVVLSNDRSGIVPLPKLIGARGAS